MIVQEIYNARPESFNKYAPLFHELIQKNGAKTLLFCTASISSMYPKGFQDLLDMEIPMGKELKIPVAAAGKAWLIYWGDPQTTPEEPFGPFYAPGQSPPRQERLIHLRLHPLCRPDRA